MNEQDAALKIRDSIQAVFLDLMLDEDVDPTEDDFEDSELMAEALIEGLGLRVVALTDTTITCEITNFTVLPE